VNTCIALATTRKNQLSISDYFAKMRSYADEMASAGAGLPDEELVSYILAGLDEDYNPVFTAIVARTDFVTPDDLYTQLLSFKQHLTLQAKGSLVVLVTVLTVDAVLVVAAMQATGGAPVAPPLVLAAKCVTRSGTQPTIFGTDLMSTCRKHIPRDHLQLPMTMTPTGTPTLARPITSPAS
jgi:hypothetical protein